MCQELHVIGGPTGVGKTRYGLAIARRLHTEIISADSMQIYQHFDIGTAKPTQNECGDVPYHLIDIVDPRQDEFDLARYIKRANEIIARLNKAGKIPLVVGGTGLYIQGLLEGIFDGPGRDDVIRRKLEDQMQREGIAALHQRLRDVDPDTAQRLHPHDRVRIIRALEVFELTGTSISALQRESRQRMRSYPYRMAVLTAERSDLYARIERRVEDMFAAGFVEEVQRLKDMSYAESIHSMQALGYVQVLAYLDGRATLDDAKFETRKLTRNYAKRQLTWFRHMKDAHWINVTGRTDEEIIESICSIFTAEDDAISSHDARAL